MTEQTNPENNTDLKDMQLAIEAIRNSLDQGFVLREARGISARQMEGLYAMAYNFYRAGRLDEAGKIFKFLVVFDHMQQKYWLGLAAVQQLQKDYKAAVTTYGHAALLDIKNPRPALYGAECYLALEDLENASSALESVLTFTDESTEQNRRFRARAKALQDIIALKTTTQK